MSSLARCGSTGGWRTRLRAVPSGVRSELPDIDAHTAGRGYGASPSPREQASRHLCSRSSSLSAWSLKRGRGVPVFFVQERRYAIDRRGSGTAYIAYLRLGTHAPVQKQQAFPTHEGMRGVTFQAGAFRYRDLGAAECGLVQFLSLPTLPGRRAQTSSERPHRRRVEASVG